jgi:anti-sigma B factor antagonist
VSLHVVERDIGDVTILQIKGQMVLDEGDIPLRQDVDALIRNGHIKFVFDLQDVSRLDSGGIGALVSSLLTAHRHGGAVTLLHVPARARKLLRTTRLDGVFEMFDSEEAALKSFS